MLTQWDKQARLERVMAEMDSSKPGKLFRPRQSSASWAQDFVDLEVGELSEAAPHGFSWRKFSQETTTSCFWTSRLTFGYCDLLSGWPSLENSKKTVPLSIYDCYSWDAPSTRIFGVGPSRLDRISGNYQDHVRLKAEQDERDASLLHKREQLSTNNWPGCRQPQARSTAK